LSLPKNTTYKKPDYKKPDYKKTTHFCNRRYTLVSLLLLMCDEAGGKTSMSVSTGRFKLKKKRKKNAEGKGEEKKTIKNCAQNKTKQNQIQ
jgi:hypothetical protein